MRYEFQKIRCQRCRAVNPLGQELCDQCGTRLMLVVEPTSLRYEEEQSSDAMPPALMLERMTILETGLNRFAEKLERGFELMLRQAENIHREHLLVESLIFTLVQSGLITREEIDRLWKETQERNEAERREAARREELRKQIIADPPEEDDERALFYQHVGEGFAEIAAGAPDSGLKKLEHASIFGADNFALNYYIAEHHFREGKSTLAYSYLSRCHSLKEDDPRLQLLLGLAYVDEGAQLEVGRFFINEAQEKCPSFAGHYALGRLAALEGDWQTALKEFRAARKLRKCAESHFLYALAYFETRGEEWHEREALRYVRKAIALDAEYREAHLLLGLLYRRAKDKVRAREAFARATAAYAAKRDPGKKYPRLDSERALLIGFFGKSRLTGTRLLNDGDQRIARLMREDALALSPPAL